MPIRYRIAGHIVKIIEDLQKASFETYLVGGAVRDLLLGIEPKDYDISTSATPEQIRHLFGRRSVRIIGKRFRLAHYYHGHEIVEISTFRKKPENSVPVVHERKIIFHDNDYGTSCEDAWRRDFTVNAIFYDPVENKIIDYCGNGVKDLEEGIIRIIGDASERFREDPVRILRALKLAGQYGFKFTEETEKSMLENMHLIRHSSASRLSLELEKILHKTSSHKILAVFYQRGFLGYFLPFLEKNWDAKESQYAMKLLELRNSRIEKKLYRNSLSLAIAAAALPFVETSLKKSDDVFLWRHFPGIEREIRKIILSVVAPHHFPKRLISASQMAIMLQPFFFLRNKANRKFFHHPRYHNARELMILQNEIKWKNPELPEIWPVHYSGRKSYGF